MDIYGSNKSVPEMTIDHWIPMAATGVLTMKI